MESEVGEFWDLESYGFYIYRDFLETPFRKWWDNRSKGIIMVMEQD